MFGPVGWQEILLILVLALLVFGPRRLPELGRTLGRALAEFRRATTDLKRTLNAEIALEEGERSRTPRRPELAAAASEPQGELRNGPRRETAGPPVATMPRGAEALDLAGVAEDGVEEREAEPAPAAAGPAEGPAAAEPASDDAPAERTERDDGEPATTH